MVDVEDTPVKELTAAYEPDEALSGIARVHADTEEEAQALAKGRLQRYLVKLHAGGYIASVPPVRAGERTTQKKFAALPLRERPLTSLIAQPMATKKAIGESAFPFTIKSTGQIKVSVRWASAGKRSCSADAPVKGSKRWQETHGAVDNEYKGAYEGIGDVAGDVPGPHVGVNGNLLFSGQWRYLRRWLFLTDGRFAAISQQQAKALILGWCAADGLMASLDTDNVIVYSQSLPLVYDFTAIGARAGASVVVALQREKGGVTVIRDRLVTCNTDYWKVSFYFKRTVGTELVCAPIPRPTVRQYQGQLHCVTVPNGTFYTRRWDRAAGQVRVVASITGNCEFYWAYYDYEDLIKVTEEMISGQRSPHRSTAPNRRPRRCDDGTMHRSADSKLRITTDHSFAPI